MDKPWTSHGQAMGKPWASHGRAMGKPGRREIKSGIADDSGDISYISLVDISHRQMRQRSSGFLRWLQTRRSASKKKVVKICFRNEISLVNSEI